MEKSLHIYSNERPVGEVIYDDSEDRFSLRYSPEWSEVGFPLSPYLPLTNQARPVSVKRFLENLFPEGHNLELLLEEFRISKKHTFRILQAIGGEPTGAIKFTNNGPETDKTMFRKITEAELEKRIKSRDLVIWDGKPRLSVAGVQDKLPVLILRNGDMGLGEGKLASTHILKFEHGQNKVPNLVLNEFICMRLASMAGVPAAKVNFKRLGKELVLEVKRFDRILESDTSVKRLHIIDGCQALDLPSTHKYERNLGSQRDVKHIRDGANFKNIFSLTGQCKVPAIAILQTLNWMIFNLCISNFDSHAKNISFFVDESGMTLTPFYDLVNIAMYPDLEQELAMSIGDEFVPETVKAFQFSEFCDEVSISKKIFLSQFRKIGKGILQALNNKDLIPVDLNPEELEFVGRLKDHIRLRTTALMADAEEIIHL